VTTASTGALEKVSASRLSPGQHLSTREADSLGDVGNLWFLGLSIDAQTPTVQSIVFEIP
jgi:hypothetical protein